MRKQLLTICLVALLAVGCSQEDEEAMAPQPPVTPETPTDTTDTSKKEEPETPSATIPAKYQVAHVDIAVDGGREVTSKRKEDYLD